jgi:peroxiredoxin
MKDLPRLLVLAILLFLFAPMVVQAQEATINKTNLKVGESAPDFALLDNRWERVKLSDFRGKKNVILVFYVLAFSPN